MLDILKITLVFAVIVFLLKKRWNLGLVMALSSVMMAVLYALEPVDFLRACLRSSTDITTMTLVIALLLIRVFENIMRKNGIMKEMMDSFRGIARDRRVLMASMPALIGLLPSMGGAYFSAPMVEEASKGTGLAADKKAFVNYWFRHPWEFVLPLYPGLILASAMTTFPLSDMILANLPGAMSLLAGGIFWGLSGITAEKEGPRKVSLRGAASFVPVALILFLVIVFHADLSLSIGVVVILLFTALRCSFKDMAQSLKQGFSWEIVVIILGVMAFKEVMETSGAVSNISTFFSERGIPILPVLFFIPFISGLLTGLTIGFVGSTFPIIMGLENAHTIGAVSFAFASGYIGVLLSPVHLCLVLTKEYFKAGMKDIYRRTAKGCLLILLSALTVYFILAR